MSWILLLLIASLVYIVPAYILTLPVLFIGKKRAGWLRFESCFLYIPLLVFFVIWLSVNSPHVKGFGNLFTEIFWSGIAGGLLLIPRLLIKAKSNERKYLITAVSTFIICLIVFLIDYYMPSLGE